MINKLKKALKSSNILNSSYIYIYSDFRFFFEKYKNDTKKKILNLLNFLMKNGATCITPSFSYTKFGKFDVKRTKSKVGFLSNFILDNVNFSRSYHPLFSYIAIGKNKKLVQNIGKSAFGKYSLHEILKNKECYFLHLNRPLKKGNTLMHHLEQKNKVKYRFEKRFFTKVYEKKLYLGNNFKAFVRKDLNNKDSNGTFLKAFKKIKKKKYFLRKKVGKIELLIYPYDNFYKDLDKLIKKDPNIFINGNF